MDFCTLCLRNQIFLHVSISALAHLFSVCIAGVVASAVARNETDNNAYIFYCLPLFPRLVGLRLTELMVRINRCAGCVHNGPRHCIDSVSSGTVAGAHLHHGPTHAHNTLIYIDTRSWQYFISRCYRTQAQNSRTYYC